MIYSGTPFQTVFGFPRHIFDESKLSYLSLQQCEDMHKRGECDKLPIDEFLQHLNMGCIPVESEYYILR